VSNQTAAIGTTNQVKLLIVWERTGKPIYNAIVQCCRTAEIQERLKNVTV